MLASKVALITGAAQGIGLAATRLMLRNGARVSMLDINESVGTSSCSSLQKEFSANDVMFTKVDVTKIEDLTSAFEHTKQTFGGLDIIVNNAGIDNEIHWKKMIDINLVAVIEGTKLGLGHMSTKKGGRGGVIVNVASMGGLVGMPFSPVYSGSKHGVVGYSRSLRDRALTDGVRVNIICPEFVDTPMVTDNLADLDKKTRAFIKGTGLISPEKVAEGILELVTDSSKTGAVMTVTLSRGLDYYRLLGEPELTKSKL